MNNSLSIHLSLSQPQESCFFCKVQHDSEAVLYQNDSLFLVLDGFPVSPGHGLLVPKRHVANLADLTKGEWDTYYDSINEAMHSIESTNLRVVYEKHFRESSSKSARWFNKRALEHPRLDTKPDAYNHGLNNGRAAGRTVDHLHWHIIPRFEGDMDDPRGGVRYVIPDMGNYTIER